MKATTRAIGSSPGFFDADYASWFAFLKQLDWQFETSYEIAEEDARWFEGRPKGLQYSGSGPASGLRQLRALPRFCPGCRLLVLLPGRKR